MAGSGQITVTAVAATTTTTASGMVAGMVTGAKSSRLEPQVQSRENELEMQPVSILSKPTPSAMLPPTTK